MFKRKTIQKFWVSGSARFSNCNGRSRNYLFPYGHERRIHSGPTLGLLSFVSQIYRQVYHFHHFGSNSLGSFYEPWLVDDRRGCWMARFDPLGMPKHGFLFGFGDVSGSGTASEQLLQVIGVWREWLCGGCIRGQAYFIIWTRTNNKKRLTFLFLIMQVIILHIIMNHIYSNVYQIYCIY